MNDIFPSIKSSEQQQYSPLDQRKPLSGKGLQQLIFSVLLSFLKQEKKKRQLLSSDLPAVEMLWYALD